MDMLGFMMLVQSIDMGDSVKTKEPVRFITYPIEQQFKKCDNIFCVAENKRKQKCEDDKWAY